jgi:predicted nucleotidyltransferase
MREVLLDVLVGALRRHDDVVAVWVDGSIGRGVADAHSDIDIGVAVADDRLDEFLGQLPGVVRAVCDPVLLRSMGRLLTLVTQDWLRADVFVRTGAETGRGIPGPVDVVHDPDNLVHVLTEPPAPPRGRLAEVIEEFLRCLGLFPVVAARDEWIGAYIASGMMVGLLAELMQLENGTHRVGGALRLNQRLTDEQRRELTALPPLRPERQSVIDTQTALAQAFLARAPRAAEAAGVPYPARLDAAARAHLARAGLIINT